MKQLLTESFSIDFHDTNLVVKRTDLVEALGGSKKILVEGLGDLTVLGAYRLPIGPVDRINKNGRMYTEDTWRPCLEARQGEGAIGNLDHPAPGAQPSIKDGFGVWKNHKIETLTLPDGSKGKFLCADLFLADNFNGKHVQGLIDAGARVEASTRGFGDLDEQTNVVQNYQFCTTDLVSISSGNVGVVRSDALPKLPEGTSIKSGPFLKESLTDQKPPKSAAPVSNNHNPQADKSVKSAGAHMERLLLKKMIAESLQAETPTKAFFQLDEIAQEIGTQENLKDILEDVKAKKAQLQKIMIEEEAGKGDANDTGSADASVLHPADQKGIKDTDEKEPEDIKPIDVDDEVKDTEAADRTDSEQKFKPGASVKAIGYEIRSGESPVSMAPKAEGIELTLTADTTIYETEDGHPYVEGADGKFYAIDPAILTEQTDEEEPEDVEPLDVEKLDDEREVGSHEDSNEIEDPDNGSGTDDIKPGSGMAVKENLYNLNRMGKSDLIDLAVSMSQTLESLKQKLQVEQACYAVLDQKFLKLETYTLMSEQILNRDVGRMEKAQTEVVESVEAIKTLTSQLEAANAQINELQEGVTALENHIKGLEESDADASAVQTFVNESLIQNPKLLAWETELKHARSIPEARVAMAKYASMGGKQRLDLPLTEAALGSSRVRMTESQIARRQMSDRGMI